MTDTKQNLWRPLDEMLSDDAACAPTWFTGPQSATARAIRDRRGLLSEVEQLTRERDEAYDKGFAVGLREISRLRASNAAVAKLEAEVEQLRGALERIAANNDFLFLAEMAEFARETLAGEQPK